MIRPEPVPPDSATIPPETPETLTCQGRTFTLYRDAAVTFPVIETPYRLVSKHGHEYRLFRNLRFPTLLFAVRGRSVSRMRFRENADGTLKPLSGQ